MPHYVKVAAAQMGAINEGTTREECVDRMQALLDQAIAEDVEILAYPELCLTPYFPKRIRDDVEHFYETEMPNKVVEPLLERARAAGVAVHIGYAERAGTKRFNSSVYIDGDGTVLGVYRKIHLPGTTKPDGYAKVFEPYFFDIGDSGFKVFAGAKARVGIAICQDRRYGESFRCLGLMGAEVVISGYNTPSYPLSLAHNELSLRAGAYQNMLFVIGVAHCGVEDGLELIAGSCIVDPLGEIVAKASTSADELVAARIDLDVMTPARKRWNFFGRRHPEHYGLLTQPVKPPTT